ncbi:MAG TPA: helix-turn-helix domain-containing protein [Planococcus sp. (in: firmicutes)]|nr:helix-turn-helix domain-containing protein [Planococcus sp. (in: firmicutes)]
MEFLQTYHTAGHIRTPIGQTHAKPLHQHANTCEVLLVLAGTGRFTINRKSYTVRPGSVVLYNAGDWHKEIADPRSPFEALFLCCSGQLADGIPISHIREKRIAPVQQLKEFGELQELLGHIITEHQSQAAHQPLTGHLLALFFCKLALSLAPGAAIYSPDLDRLIRKAQHYIEENHCRDITLADLSAQLGLNKYYLARQFKEFTGVSPIQYAIQCRMQTAQHLLTETSGTIAEIAAQTGYKSATHFQQAFKKAVGLSPGAFRRETSAPRL